MLKPTTGRRRSRWLVMRGRWSGLRGRWSVLPGRLLVLMWALLALAAGLAIPVGLHHPQEMSLEAPGSSSARATALIERGFPEIGSRQVILAFDSPTLTLDAEPYQRALAATTEALGSAPGIGQVMSVPAPPDLDPHHTYLAAGVRGDADLGPLLPLWQERAERAAARASSGRVEVALTGFPPVAAELQRTGLADLRTVEAVTLPAALVVLTVGLGAVGSAVVLLGTAAFGVLLGAGAMAALGTVLPVDSTSLTVVSTVGLAVGLDYSLLILLRYRRHRRDGDAPLEAARRTRASAGRAVLWCAGAVVLTCTGLLTVPLDFVRTMAAAAVVATASTAVVAVTALPAALARLDALLTWGRLRVARGGGRGRLHTGRGSGRSRFRLGPGSGRLRVGRAGDRLRTGQGSDRSRPCPDQGGGRLARPAPEEHVVRPSLGERPTPPAALGERFTRHLMRRPWPYLLGALAVVALAAAPAGQLRLGLQLDRGAIADTPAGRGLQQLEADGLTNVTFLALPHRPGTGPVDTTLLADALRSDPRVSGFGVLDNGRDLTVVTITDRVRADSPASAGLVDDLRATAAQTLPGRPAYSGGPAAALADLRDAAVAAAKPVAVLAATGSFLLMLVAFRSVVLPLKALAMNVLSTAAAFGLLAWVTGQTAQTVNVGVPLLALTVVFGLSLDYEILLVHRVTEHYRTTGDHREAVARGMRDSARPITVGAAVMATVFAGLMATHRQDFQQLGFLVAAAVLLDATLIRIVVVPALMRLLGHRNWWMPRVLHRLVPPVAVRPALPPQRPGHPEKPAPVATATHHRGDRA
ncbi:MMPL family transporter [Streptomyces sp. NPDC002643]